MIKNLKKALDDKNISLKAYASFLGVSEKTAWNKLNESTDFSYPEALKTNKELLPEYNMDYLFASDGSSRVSDAEDEKGA